MLKRRDLSSRIDVLHTAFTIKRSMRRRASKLVVNTKSSMQNLFASLQNVPGLREPQQVQVEGVTVSGSTFYFSKHPMMSFKEFFGISRTKRVGVPGHPTFDASSLASLARFGGTSFQAVFTSPIFYIHIMLLAVIAFVHHTDLDSLRGANVPETALNTLVEVTVFSIALFMGSVYSRFNERFHDCADCNAGCANVAALVTGNLAQDERARARAASIVRYVVAMIHVAYLQISGSMTAEKWAFLYRRGILLRSDVARLVQTCGSACSFDTVLFQWCLRLLWVSVRDGYLSTEESAQITDGIAAIRRLSNKQEAYTTTQVPLVYFHLMGVCVHLSLALTSWRAARAFVFDLGACSPDLDAHDARPCGYAGAVLQLVVQSWVIFVFVGLYATAVWMADPMGTRACNYDMQVDLEKVWAEALASIHAMVHADEIEVPNLAVTATGVQFESVEKQTGDIPGVGGHYVNLNVLARSSQKAVDGVETIGKGLGASSAS